MLPAEHVCSEQSWEGMGGDTAHYDCVLGAHRSSFGHADLWEGWGRGLLLRSKARVNPNAS